MSFRLLPVALTLVGTTALATPGFAKEEAESSEVELEEGGGEAASASEEGSKADAPEDSKAAAEEAAAEKKKADAVEAKGQTYQFVGARYRLILIPKFVFGLFAEGGATVAVHSFGPEYVIRKDGFEYQFALSYAPYSMDPTPFKSKTDPEDAWELAESRLKVLYVSADFMWSHEFSPQLALNYGGGVGLGFVFGSIYRNQAYKDASGNFQPCTDLNGTHPIPGTGLSYCAYDPDLKPNEQHINNYSEPSLTSGGSKPPVFPWLAVQTGLRYKPHPKFVARLDVGVGLSGFFFGLGADYGL